MPSMRHVALALILVFLLLAAAACGGDEEPTSAPAIQLAPGNPVAPIWVVENGVEGQHNIVDTVPGEADYTPLWAVTMVTFADGVEPYLLTSAAAVEEAAAAGDATLTETETVVNCPII